MNNYKELKQEYKRIDREYTKNAMESKFGGTYHPFNRELYRINTLGVIQRKVIKLNVDEEIRHNLKVKLDSILTEAE